MTQEEKKLLTDIEQAALHIDVHLEGRRIFEEFANNITKRRAIERELEIIGEATNNLLKINDDLPLTSARKIVNLRNRVIHAYDAVDETIIWKVIMKDIPVLCAPLCLCAFVVQKKAEHNYPKVHECDATSAK